MDGFSSWLEIALTSLQHALGGSVEIVGWTRQQADNDGARQVLGAKTQAFRLEPHPVDLSGREINGQDSSQGVLDSYVRL